MDNFTSSCFTNAIGYPGSFARYWMMEEEDDDTHFLVDDDEAEAATYNHLVQAESSSMRRQFDAPRKVIRLRDLRSGDKRIKANYFAPNPVYSDKQFRRRFRMRRHLFKHIKEAVKNQDNYFKKKYDATGKEGLSALQKCVAAMPILAYGVPADAIDEYVRIDESTARKALHHFCRAIIDVFGEYYLRAPNAADVARLLQEGEDRGFPRMGHSTPVSFAVNGRTYNMGYYLADGIYPEWAAFVKTIHYPMEQKTQHFATAQESARKDIERAFGVLQTRFAVIRGPAYGWDRNQINDIMVTCIILHNMIVEDEQDNARDTDFLNIGELAVRYRNNPDREAFVAAHHRLHDQNTHFQLQYDLIEHQWMRLGYHHQ
nr:uncharacterized protein LOC117856488 [Setaria viridis]